MLTETDLAIVRAALMFLDEEFFPDQEEMFQHYLDDEGVLAGASTDQIKATRAKFEAADLYVAVKQLDLPTTRRLGRCGSLNRQTCPRSRRPSTRLLQ